MRRYANKGVVALEEDDLSVVSADETTAPASIEAAEAEAEVVDNATEGDDLNDSIEEGGEVVEALESIADALKISAANGGLDKHSAHVVGIATQYMYGRVGLKAKAMPALESFGGTSTRIGATQLAMEGIKEKAREIWAYIVKAYKKVLAWATGHFRKLFGAADAMKKRAVAINKAVDGYRTKKIKDKTFDNVSLVKNLYVNNGVTAAAVIAKLSSLETHTKTVLDTNASARVAAGDDIVAAIEDSNKIINIKPLESIANKDADDVVLKSLGTPSADFKWKVTDSFLGGKTWAESVPNVAPTVGAKALESFAKAKVGFMSDGTKTPTKESLPTLAVNEIDSISTTVGKIADILVDFKKTEDKLKALLDRVTKAAERMSKNADNDVGDAPAATDATATAAHGTEVAEKEHGKLVRSATDNIRKYVLNVFVNASSYPLTTGQAALSYCEQSFKQYE